MLKDFILNILTLGVHSEAMEEIEKEDLEIFDFEFKMKKQMKKMREINEKLAKLKI
jgi:hypothetical protein